MAARETEMNAYAKFWTTNKEYYGMLWYFLSWLIVTPSWYTNKHKVKAWFPSDRFDLRVAPQNIVSNEDLQSHLILKARNGIVVNISPRSTP